MMIVHREQLVNVDLGRPCSWIVVLILDKGNLRSWPKEFGLKIIKVFITAILRI